MGEERPRTAREYAERARAHGKSDEAIRKALQKGGLQPSEIDELLADLGPPPSPPPHGASTKSSDAKDFSVAAVGGSIAVSKTLKDAFRTVTASPGPFLLVGAATGGLLIAGAGVAELLPDWSFLTVPVKLVPVAAFVGVGFACLCAMALQALNGEPVRLPGGHDILWIAPSAMIVGGIGACALWIGVWGPLELLVPRVIEGAGLDVSGGFFSSSALLQGFMALVIAAIFALPISFALVYLLVLPGLSLSLPAIADGANALRALALSFGRGMSNFGAMFGLSFFYSLIFFALCTGASTLISPLMDAPSEHPVLGPVVAAATTIAVTAIFAPWLAALLSSAYLQTTGGGGGDGRLRREPVLRVNVARAEAPAESRRKDNPQ